MKYFKYLVLVILSLVIALGTIHAQNKFKSKRDFFIVDSATNHHSNKAQNRNYIASLQQTKPISTQNPKALGSVQVDPCLQYAGGPYGNFNTPECYPNCETATVAEFEVWANEAYVFSGLTPDTEYTFEFCNGYDPANNWAANITIAERDGNTPTNNITTVAGCSATFTAPASGDAIAVIFDVCGNPELQVDNGFPTFRCTGSGSTLPTECAGLGSCNDPILLECGDMVMGNTADGQNTFEQHGTMTGYTGSELVYEFEVDPGRLEIDLTNLNSNLDLFVLSFCNDPINTQEIVSTNSGTNDESIGATIVEGGTFYIIVDGLQGATSTFDLSLSCASPCTDSLAVNRNPIAETNYRAANVISSTGRVESGTTVGFAAGNTISLIEGFTVENGATFTASIQACSVSNGTLVEARQEEIPTSNIPHELKVFPNPFRNETTIQFHLAKSSDVALSITDINGRIVHQQQYLDAQEGWQHHQFEASHLPNGMYFLYIQTAEQQMVKQLIIQK